MKEIRFQTDVLPLKDKLFRLALRITLNRQEAEDIVQDTLIRVWNKRDEWDQIENIEAYATTICRNLALDRSNQVRNRTIEDTDINDHTTVIAASPPPDEALHQRQSLEIVRQLMDNLPETWRTIMLLRDVEEKSYKEIADILGINETQVKVYLHRARTKIKTTIEKINQYGL